MLVLVFGGSGSGKSAFAETICMKQKQQSDSMYYLATMESCDSECSEKILRHRQLRDGKGFLTLEQPRDISCCSFIESTPEHRVVLLECLTTLLTNEVYRPDDDYRYRDASEELWSDLQILKRNCRDMIIVSSDVFRSGEEYDAETMGYIQQLGYLHTKIAEQADLVYEVVAGIPVCIKDSKL